MAKESAPQETKQPDQAAASQPFISKKMIIIGIPVFLVQVALFYFLLSKFVGSHPVEAASKSDKHETEAVAEEGIKNIFVIKDVIVNPSGTNGTRFLLTTIGVEVTTAEAMKEMETLDIQIRDALNSILTSKGLVELSDAHQREKLREEIGVKISSYLKTGKTKNVYFSKFIIQ